MNITSAELARLQAAATGFVKRKRTNKKPIAPIKSIPRTEKISLTLPFPPSVNNYWGKGMYGNVFLKPAAVKYKKDVDLILTMNGFIVAPLMDKIGLKIVSHQKDGRRYDVDNLLKALLDSMKGKVFIDDFNVDEVSIKRGNIDKSNPRVEVEVTTIGSFEITDKILDGTSYKNI